jgi:hypothetical protein
MGRPAKVAIRKPQEAPNLSTSAPRQKKTVKLRHMPQPNAKDMSYWYLHEQRGLAVDEIANLKGVKSFAVQASLDYVQEWKHRNNLQNVEAKLNFEIMKSLDGVGKVLQEGMKAEKVVHIDRVTGKMKKVADHAMRVKVVAEVRALIDTAKPRTPAVQLNQQFNNGSPGGGGYGPGVSFEAILRKKREARGLLNSQSDEAVGPELSHADSVAEEFKDFCGDEDEEDEDDDAE